MIAAPETWTPVQSKCKRPASGTWCARPACIPSGSREVRRCSASRCGGCLPEDRRRRGRLDRHSTAAARHRQQFRRPRRRSDPRSRSNLPSADRFDRNASAQSATGPPRSLSCRPNFSGGDHGTPAFAHAARDVGRHRFPVRLAAHTQTGARRRPRSPRSRHRAAWLSTGSAWFAPVGDPDWVSLRGDRALVLDGKPAASPLDSFFALNPAMPNLHRLYQAQQAIIVHAAATPS